METPKEKQPPLLSHHWMDNKPHKNITEVIKCRNCATLEADNKELREMLELCSMELESGGKKHWEINSMIKELLNKER